MNYRSQQQIYADLLEASQANIITTKLLSKTNLPHTRFKGYIRKLAGAGLMVEMVSDGKHMFVITDKGRLFLEEYKRFYNVAETFGLEI